MDEWIKKMWYIYTKEYYSALKKNEIMFLAGSWVGLESNMLSKTSQAQKNKYHICFLSCAESKFKRKIDTKAEERLFGGMGNQQEEGAKRG
jgi:hypothetical protein